MKDPGTFACNHFGEAHPLGDRALFNSRQPCLKYLKQTIFCKCWSEVIQPSIACYQEYDEYKDHPYCPARFAAPHLVNINKYCYKSKSGFDEIPEPGKTKIEIDGNNVIQLIQEKRSLAFSSLKYMAEKVEGSFVFIILNKEIEGYLYCGEV